MRTLAGESLQLPSGLQGPLLMTFWSVTCVTCVAEIPTLIKLHQSYAEKGVTVLGVSASYDNPSHIVNMVKKYPIPYKIVWDHDASLALDFGKVRATPTTLLIATDGSIAMRIVGAFSEKKLRTRIEKMLAVD